jgi:hypothetical protein
MSRVAFSLPPQFAALFLTKVICPPFRREQSADAAGEDLRDGPEALIGCQVITFGGTNARARCRMDPSNEGVPTATFAWRRARRLA